jgi:transcriptional regulator with XRE-family HTH domain
MAEGEAGALRVAFDALLALADPPRQAAVLRAGLKMLVLEAAAPRFHHAPPSPRQQPELPNTGATWPEFRSRLRAMMARDKVSSASLAQAIGISHPTAQRILAPSSGPPGAKVLTALEAWLNTCDTPPASANGHVAPTTSNGNGASAPRHKLTVEEQQRLAGYLSLDEKTLRGELGLTAELLSRAVAGQAMPVEVIERLAAFLAGNRQ